MNNYSYFKNIHYIYNKLFNMRKKLPENEKKIRVTITLNREIDRLSNEQNNKSKYIENLIYQDLLKNKKIKNILL